MFFSSYKKILLTSAGASALAKKVAWLSDQVTISIFSPCNSFTTAWTLEPLIPTQAPTGSIVESSVKTLILALEPGSLATLLTVITPSYISGTSWKNNFDKNWGWVLDKKTW